MSGGLEWLGELQSLEEVLLWRNSFAGPLPSMMRTMSRLRKLELANNPLNCDFPDWIGELQNLTELVAYDANFEGTLPATLGGAGSGQLKRVFLRDNRLSGTLEEGMCVTPHATRHVQDLIDLIVDCIRTYAWPHMLTACRSVSCGQVRPSARAGGAHLIRQSDLRLAAGLGERYDSTAHARTDEAQAEGGAAAEHHADAEPPHAAPAVQRGPDNHRYANGEAQGVGDLFVSGLRLGLPGATMGERPLAQRLLGQLL